MRKMATYISGCVLSSLCFEQLNCEGDQEGFLLGRVEDHVRDTISDSQINNFKVEKRIYIYSYRSWSKINRICDRNGHLAENTFNKFFKDVKKDIIGWYKFRRNSSMRMSMKEISVHKNICYDSLLPNTNDFQFMLCCFSSATNLCTRSLDYSFHIMNDCGFQKVPVTVVNLGDTTHSEYKLQKMSSVNLTSGVFPSFVKQFENAFLDPGGQVTQLHQVRQMNTSLQNKLQELSNYVNTSEQQVGHLEQEIKKLSGQLKQKEEEKRKLLPLPTPPISQEELEIAALEKKLDANIDFVMNSAGLSTKVEAAATAETAANVNKSDANSRSTSAVSRTSSFQRNSAFRRRISESSSHTLSNRTPKQKSKNVPLDILSTDNPPIPATGLSLLDVANQTSMLQTGSKNNSASDDLFDGVNLETNAEISSLNLKEKVAAGSKNSDLSVQDNQKSEQVPGTNDYFSFISSVVQEEKKKTNKNSSQEPQETKSCTLKSSHSEVPSNCSDNAVLQQGPLTYIMDGEVPSTSDRSSSHRLRSRGLRAKSKADQCQGSKLEKPAPDAPVRKQKHTKGTEDVNVDVQQQCSAVCNGDEHKADTADKLLLSSSPVF